MVDDVDGGAYLEESPGQLGAVLLVVELLGIDARLGEGAGQLVVVLLVE